MPVLFGYACSLHTLQPFLAIKQSDYLFIYLFTKLEGIFIVVTCQSTQCYGPEEKNIILYCHAYLRSLYTGKITWYFVAYIVVQNEKRMNV
jgi:hypothetical protein